MRFAFPASGVRAVTHPKRELPRLFFGRWIAGLGCSMDRRKFLKAALAPLSRPLGAAQTQGPVELSLEARPDWVEVGGQIARLYTFNGQVPGPAIEAHPASEVRIAFRNRLPETVNLHFHGLHIPPTGFADNVMLRIPPQESLDYRFTLPADHPAGTFWYHPHVHGSAARQVSRGLAGVFIVRGELDRIPEMLATPESMVVLQDFDLDAAGQPRDPSPMERMNGREGRLVTVSGQAASRFDIQRDGWHRLRFVNASSSRVYRLRLEEHPIYVIGTEGGFLNSPEPRDEILLSPGERADTMIRGERPPGEYRLLSLPYDRGQMGFAMGGMRPGLQPGTIALATVRYEGQAESPWQLPSRLAQIDPLPAPSVRRSFHLGSGQAMGAGMRFTINGQTFNENRVDTRGALGAVEQREFVNSTSMDHPMHIHTNPFQVVRAGGTPTLAWKDTVLVPAQSRVTIRTLFRDFAGATMYHCHILDHEDLGMMGTLEIAPIVSEASERRRGGPLSPA